MYSVDLTPFITYAPNFWKKRRPVLSNSWIFFAQDDLDQLMDEQEDKGEVFYENGEEAVELRKQSQ